MSQNSGEITANLVDIENRVVLYAKVVWRDGIITEVVSLGAERSVSPYLSPGLIDAHIHIESSMLTPAEFGRQAVRHGTVATVSDPHEIANVLGVDGIRFMLDSAESSPCKLYFGIPSCVPATPFETAGASLGVEAIATLFDLPRIVALAEMMNYPGVLNGDAEVMAKLTLAHERGYPVDGHAPGLRGEAARRYAEAGIGTDHECYTLEEALEKIAAGMIVQIREGSAARNFEALHSLISTHPDKVMLCSDDKHPDDLVSGHINRLAARAVGLGHDRFDVLRCASLNPVRHYRLPVGMLKVGDPMDAVLFDDLISFSPRATYVSGAKVAGQGVCLTEGSTDKAVNNFQARPLEADSLCISAENAKQVRVIAAVDGELVTRALNMPPLIVENRIEPDPSRDMLQLVVLNRYQSEAKPSLGFIRGIGLKRGAIASTVAHDSHNIIAVGCSRDEIARAIDALVATGGGISVCDGETLKHLPLPVAGLMSPASGEEVAAQYAALDKAAKSLGSPLRAPFMTLSFMALLVIPSLKLSDKGLFDGERFAFTPLVIA